MNVHGYCCGTASVSNSSFRSCHPVGHRLSFAFECAIPHPATSEIAEAVGLNRNQVGVWRHRWKAAFYDLVAVECSEGIPALKQAISKLLSDAPRSGRPPSTTSEQLTQVASLAREHPSDSGLPISQWTSSELVSELLRRTVFDTVSASSVRRWLDRMDLKPHRHKYWLFSPDRSTNLNASIHWYYSAKTQLATLSINVSITITRAPQCQNLSLPEGGPRHCSRAVAS